MKLADDGCHHVENFSIPRIRMVLAVVDQDGV